MELTIRSIGHRGDGLAEREGRAFAVPKTLPGEVVRLADGKAPEILTPSPDRVVPVCPYFAACGGCALQHWDRERYRYWKRKLLVKALDARGIEPTVAELLDAHGAGRRRVSLHVRRIDGRWQAGFMAARTHDLCPIGRCPIVVPALQEATAIAAACGELFGDCDVAVTAADNGLDVSVKAERLKADPHLHRAPEILHRFSLARLSVNGDLAAEAAKPLVTMGAVQVPLPMRSFLQATAMGEQELARLVLEGVGKAKHVADLFCGIGPFTLRLAEKARVLAVDSDRDAMASLDAALKGAQGLKPVKLETRDLFTTPLVPSELKGFDAVVFDPPRAGAESQARALARSTVKTVVAVSCDPTSFARDATILAEGGYRFKAVTPVDQFLWSPHLETVAVFQRA